MTNDSRCVLIKGKTEEIAMRQVPVLIQPDTGLVKIVLDTTSVISDLPRAGRMSISPCLSVIGELGESEVVLIEKPIVPFPDIEEDSHWSPLKVDQQQVQLSVGHDVEPIQVALILRITKPVTVNSVGVGWI